MAEDFFLDESRFRRFTGDLRGIGDDLKGDQATLSNLLARFTGCWGGDEIGKGFENNYWEDSEKVRIGAGKAGDGIVDTAGGAQKSADYLAGLDEETARRLDLETRGD